MIALTFHEVKMLTTRGAGVALVTGKAADVPSCISTNARLIYFKVKAVLFETIPGNVNPEKCLEKGRG